MLLFKICQPHYSINDKIKNQLYNYKIYHCLISTSSPKLALIPLLSNTLHLLILEFFLQAYSYLTFVHAVFLLRGAGRCLNGIP